MTINTLDLLYTLSSLLKNSCETATVSHGKLDGEPCLFISGNRSGKKVIDFAPIFDVNSPNAPKDYPISADTAAPIIPSFGELVLTSEAYHTAVEHCEYLQNDPSLSADDKDTVAFARNAFKDASDKLDCFLSEYIKIS